MSEVLVSTWAIPIYKGSSFSSKSGISLGLGDQSRLWGKSRTSVPGLPSPLGLLVLLSYVRSNPWIRPSPLLIEGGFDMPSIICLVTVKC